MIFENCLIGDNNAVKRCQTSSVTHIVRFNRLRLASQNPLWGLSQEFGARFDFMRVITRSKNKNYFLKPTLGSDYYGS